MYPGYHLDRILSGAHDHRLMDSVPGVHPPRSIGTSAIAPAHHLLINAVPEHLGNLAYSEVHTLLDGAKAWLVLIGFYRNHHRGCTGCAPPSCFQRVRTEGAIVSLNEACVWLQGEHRYSSGQHRLKMFCWHAVSLSDFLEPQSDSWVSFALRWLLFITCIFCTILNIKSNIFLHLSPLPLPLLKVSFFCEAYVCNKKSSLTT